MSSDRREIRFPEADALALQLSAGRTAAGAVFLALPVLSFADPGRREDGVTRLPRSGCRGSLG